MREGNIGMEFDVWLICNYIFKGYPVIYVERMALHWPLGSMECYSKIFVGFKLKDMDRSLSLTTLLVSHSISHAGIILLSQILILVIR